MVIPDDLAAVWLIGFGAGFMVAAIVALVRLGIKIFKRVSGSS